MHELILDLVREAPAGYRLVRLPLDEGAMVALFQDGPAPRWIAKTARNPAGVERLRAEAWALGQLQKHADVLGVPRLLGWRHEASPDGACLVISAVPGRPMLAPNAWGLPFTLPMRTIEAWLRGFQALMTPNDPLTVADLAVAARIQVELDGSVYPDQSSLLAGLMAGLQTIPLHTGADAAAAMIHGDFWAGNVLGGTSGRMSVIDWSGFGVGTKLDDMLCWHAYTPQRHEERERLKRWRRLFFMSGAARDQLRRWSLQAGYSPDSARLSFYLFLLRRMSWELGLRLQHRNAEEQTRARQEWTAVVAWLAQNGYPDPFLMDQE